MNNKYTLITGILVLLFSIVMVILAYSWNKKEVNPTPSISPTAPTVSSVPTSTPTPIVTQNNNITYTTFSSSKADFTFEYPSTWVYDEKTDPYNSKATDWAFYINSNDKTGVPILAVISPMTEVVDFCSGGPATAMGNLYSFTLSVFPTNDSETFITYEHCGGEDGSGYIYWQKGKYFANATDIKDIHKVNLMKFYSNSEEGQKIAKHIAQSIKIR